MAPADVPAIGWPALATLTTPLAIAVMLAVTLVAVMPVAIYLAGVED
jgi:hypothetical protein